MRRILIAILVTTFSAVIGATTLVPTDVEEMSREAVAVAVGRVAGVEPRWAGDRRRIETVVTLRAEDYLKGSLGPNISFVVPGGQIGRYRSIVVGAPRFAEGEQIVVFLGARVPAMPFIVGFNQGLFRVGSVNGEAMVTPAGPSLRLVRTGAWLRLDEFARQVRAYAEAAR